MALEEISFTVEGSYPFPLDMLRYDSCWPATSVDARAIEESVALEGSRGAVTVNLHCYRDRKYQATATKDRWHSFSWEVTIEE